MAALFRPKTSGEDAGEETKSFTVKGSAKLSQQALRLFTKAALLKHRSGKRGTQGSRIETPRRRCVLSSSAETQPRVCRTAFRTFTPSEKSTGRAVVVATAQIFHTPACHRRPDRRVSFPRSSLAVARKPRALYNLQATHIDGAHEVQEGPSSNRRRNGERPGDAPFIPFPFFHSFSLPFSLGRRLRAPRRSRRDAGRERAPARA